MGLSNLLTVKEVAAYLKTSRQQVRKMIQSGTLYAVQVGREYRISEEALAAWLNIRSDLEGLGLPVRETSVLVLAYGQTVPKNPYVGRRIEKNPAQNRRGVTCATPLRLKLDISYHGAFLCANRQNTFLVQLGMGSCFEPHKRERLPPEEKSIIKFKKRPVFFILDITKDTGCFG